MSRSYQECLALCVESWPSSAGATLSGHTQRVHTLQLKAETLSRCGGSCGQYHAARNYARGSKVVSQSRALVAERGFGSIRNQS